MTNQLKLIIEGFSDLEEYGEKEDGSPDIRRNDGYKIKLTINGTRILFEETIPRAAVPVNPSKHLSERVAQILAPYLPQIDPSSI